MDEPLYGMLARYGGPPCPPPTPQPPRRDFALSNYCTRLYTKSLFE